MSLRQLVQPGCQKAFNGAVSGISGKMGSDASPRAAEDFLDPERGIAVLVTDITNLSAVWRKARLGPIEVTEGQWERCGTVHGRQPELLPLTAVITAE